MELPGGGGAFHSPGLWDKIHHSMRGTESDEGQRPLYAWMMWRKTKTGWLGGRCVVELLHLCWYKRCVRSLTRGGGRMALL
jgi:hypothetical protein